jgi:hypothetical protein
MLAGRARHQSSYFQRTSFRLALTIKSVSGSGAISERSMWAPSFACGFNQFPLFQPLLPPPVRRRAD